MCLCLQASVAPLAHLGRLHCLDLIDCKLTNLAALSALTGLRRLGMRKSQATDIGAIVGLSRCVDQLFTWPASHRLSCQSL